MACFFVWAIDALLASRSLELLVLVRLPLGVLVERLYVTGLPLMRDAYALVSRVSVAQSC